MPLQQSHINSIQTERANLISLRDTLYQNGAKQLGDAVRNALSELNTGAVNGVINNFGVNQDAVRR